jgi:hypothetical protein
VVLIEAARASGPKAVDDNVDDNNDGIVHSSAPEFGFYETLVFEPTRGIIVPGVRYFSQPLLVGLPATAQSRRPATLRGAVFRKQRGDL